MYRNSSCFSIFLASDFDFVVSLEINSSTPTMHNVNQWHFPCCIDAINDTIEYVMSDVRS